MDRITLIFAVSAAVFFCRVSAADLTAKAAEADAKQESFVEGTDGWRFLPAELRFAEKLDSPDISAVTESAIGIIADFDDQLGNKGVSLVVVPVPPKALVHASHLGIKPEEQARMREGWEKIMAELAAKGVQVVDLLPDYSSATEPAFCRRDTHWSGPGMETAVTRLFPAMQSVGIATSGKANSFPWKETTIEGDLGGEPEKVKLRFPTAANEQSQLLLLGDSHVLVFSQGGDLHASGAGLSEQLAAAIGAMPAVIGVRGSGATSSRLQLARKLRVEPDFLAGKKLVVWVFAGREFTEADTWKKIPVFPSAKNSGPQS